MDLTASQPPFPQRPSESLRARSPSVPYTVHHQGSWLSISTTIQHIPWQKERILLARAAEDAITLFLGAFTGGLLGCAGQEHKTAWSTLSGAQSMKNT